MARQRIHSPQAIEAAALMGERIRLGRKRRRWSEQELADRAGIARATLRKIERGETGCAVGLVFEAAALAGVPLFESDVAPLSEQIGRARDQVALLPRRVRARELEVFDGF